MEWLAHLGAIFPSVSATCSLTPASDGLVRSRLSPTAWCRLASLSILSLIGAGCASEPPPPPLKGPATIAIASFEGTAETYQLRTVMRRVLDAYLQGRSVLTVDPDWLDSVCVMRGLWPSEDEWLEDPVELANDLRASGVAYLLVGKDFATTQVNAGVAYLDDITGRLELIELSSLDTVWSAEVDITNFGGALIDSSQVATGFRDTLDRNTPSHLLRLSVAACTDALETWPTFTNGRFVFTEIPEPRAADMHRVTPPGFDKEIVELMLSGTAGCIGRIVFEDGSTTPLQPLDSPGQYRAWFEPEKLTDPETRIANASVVLQNVYGQRKRRSIASLMNGGGER